LIPVSIPLRKVSRRAYTILGVPLLPGFHPSKEGFKAIFPPFTKSASTRFHPSKEGFKDGPPLLLRVVLNVSIPLRKVSRQVLQARADTLVILFPSL